MAMPVKRLVTTKGRDENIVETVAFPCNEDEIATWFHVNELDELQFAGGSASDLTVPEFNQVMREADGRIQKIESNIDAASGNRKAAGDRQDKEKARRGAQDPVPRPA